MPQHSSKPPCITGRFECLHHDNYTWILHSKQDTGVLPIIRLLPGEPDWFLPEFHTRKAFLENFRIAREIVPWSRLDATPDFPQPSSPDAQRYLRNVYQWSTGQTVFSSVEEYLAAPKVKTVSPMRIVTTNGCFDILHPGHIQTLQHARELGDCLLVLINSDASVRKFKGAQRPIHSELFRAAILSQLDSVDAVIVFNEDTPLAALERIQPAVHVKGGSFIESRIRAEKELLAGWNGELRTVPMLGSYSTTRLLELYGQKSLPV